MFTITSAHGSPALRVADRPGLWLPDVVVRPLEPGETGPLQAVFDGLSAQSRRMRFLTAVPSLPPAVLSALADVDHDRHGCWIAEYDGEPVGVGHYIRDGEDPTAAEIALEVVDAYQGRGLGAALLDTITTVAMARGVRRVQASAGARNARSRRLLAQVGLELRGHGPVVEGTAPLALMDPARVERPAVLALALAPAPVPAQRAASR